MNTEITSALESFEKTEKMYQDIDNAMVGLEHLLELHELAKSPSHDMQTFNTFKFSVESVMDKLHGGDASAYYTYSAEGIWDTIVEGFEKIKAAIIAFFKMIYDAAKGFLGRIFGVGDTLEKVAEIKVTPEEDAKIKAAAEQIDIVSEHFGTPEEIAAAWSNLDELKGDVSNESLTPSLESIANIDVGQLMKRVKARDNTLTNEELRIAVAIRRIMNMNHLNPLAAAFFADDAKAESIGMVNVNYDKVVRFFNNIGHAPDVDALNVYLKQTNRAIQYLKSGNEKAAMNNADKTVAKALLMDVVDTPTVVKEDSASKVYRIGRNGVEYNIRLDISPETNAFRSISSLRLTFGHTGLSNTDFHMNLKASDSLSKCVNFAKEVTRHDFKGNAKRKYEELQTLKKASEENIKAIEAVMSNSEDEKFNAHARKGIQYLRSNLTVIQAAFRILQMDQELVMGVGSAVNTHGKIMTTLLSSKLNNHSVKK